MGSPLLLGALTLGMSGILANVWVSWVARGRVTSTLEEVPLVKAAVVLGCAPTLPNGRRNVYFERRLDAAAALLHAERTELLIVSGGPLRQGSPGGQMSECEAMYEGLLTRGVAGERIFLDPEGTRTLRSVLGARDRIRGGELVFVSQRFHTVRAVFLARAYGLDAWGFNAQGPTFRSVKHIRLLAREGVSRWRAALDVVLDRGRQN